MNEIRQQFPIFVNHKDLVYLDNAATTQKPQGVINALTKYYERQNANVHRGAYKLSDISTQLYDNAHLDIANFIGARSDEVIFNSGATEGINTLSFGLGKGLANGDNVVITAMEHHSNLIPWIEMSKRYGFEVRFIGIDPETMTLRFEDIEQLIDSQTKIVSFVHVSNVLGVKNPSSLLIDKAKSVGATTIVDVCQTVSHMQLDVKAMDCDFCVFSGHKMYGPTGIGVLYGKKELLADMDPFEYGGGMVGRITEDSISWNILPMKFEAGTPHMAGAVGLSAAVKFISDIGYDAIQEHDSLLTQYAVNALSQIGGVEVFGKNAERVGVIPFVINGVHSHDAASILDSENVAVRAGEHCASPLVQELSDSGVIRASIGIYNDEKDINKLIIGIEKVKKMFHLKV